MVSARDVHTDEKHEHIKCRQLQIEQLTALLDPTIPCVPNVVLYGQEATGKTLIVTSILEHAEYPYAIVKSRECITGRHLLERTILACKAAVEEAGYGPFPDIDGRCENLGVLAVLLQQLLRPCPKFALAFDGIDRQREPPATLLAALARLSEIIPTLSTIFLTTHPSPRIFHQSSIPHIHFAPYTRAETLAILSATPQPIFPPSTLADADAKRRAECAEDDAWLWPRFCGAVYDSLGRTTERSPPALRAVCDALWPPFVAHIRSGAYGTRDFSRLMVRTRALFQGGSSSGSAASGVGAGAGIAEEVLRTNLLAPPGPAAVSIAVGAGAVDGGSLAESSRPAPDAPASNAAASTADPDAATTTSRARLKARNAAAAAASATASLPYYSRFLLVAAYLASTNPPRTDQVYFSKTSEAARKKGRKRRKNGPAGGGTPSKGANTTSSAAGTPSKPGASSSRRRVTRALLGPQPFPLERWLAILRAIVPDGYVPAGSADVMTQIATLAGLKMVVRMGGTGGGDAALDGGARWKVNVGWEFVRGVAKGLRFEVEDFVAE